LHNSLPRESHSKEIDAALLSVIGFPAFAVNDPEILERTQNDIINKLGGKYGCKRFLRDGHQTELEDTSRLHYDPNELKIFEDIECEWPLFFTYLILNGLFNNDEEMVETYSDLLEPLLVDSTTVGGLGQINDSADYSFERSTTNSRATSMSPRRPDDRFYLVPEVYYVPKDKIDAEKENPNSQIRLPNDNVPLVWANSLYFLSCLIRENLLEISQIDPLGRRFNPKHSISDSTIIQVVLLSENTKLQQYLATLGLETQTVDQIQPITICRPSQLREVYTHLGANTKLGLSGRPPRPVGTMGTCRLYRVQGNMYAFTPHFMDMEHFYLSSDNNYLISVFEQELQFVQNNWFDSGRPTMTVMLTESMIVPSGHDSSNNWHFGTNEAKALLEFMMKLKTGYVNGIRVRLGHINEMVNTSCITSLDFLSSKSDVDWVGILRNTKSTRKGTRLRPTSDKSLRRSSSGVFAGAGLKTPIPRTESQDYFGVFNKDNKLQDHFNSQDSDISEEQSDDSSNEESKMLNLSLGDPSQVPQAITTLATSKNLFDQVDLVHYLYSCHGLSFYIDPLSATVGALLEEIYTKATSLKLWSVVRQAAGLLQKMTNSLTINLTDLVIRQKMCTVGEGENEKVLRTGLGPEGLKNLIYSACNTDVMEGPMVQEILTFLGSFIRADPSIFKGIMRLRTHSILIAMREEISRIQNCDEEEAIEHLTQLSPFELKTLLFTILSGPTLSASNSKAVVQDHSHQNSSQSRERWHNFNCISGQNDGKIVLTARSAGFKAGNYAHLEINSEKVPIAKRGLNLVIINPAEGIILDTASFDTHASVHESEELVELIGSLKHGIVVMGAVKDDCYENLTPDAIKALRSLGCSKAEAIEYRDSWCFIGMKGATIGSIPEVHKKALQGPTDVLHHIITPSKHQEQVRRLIPSNPLNCLHGPSSGRWLRRRKNDGAFNRVPSNFYPKVWWVLYHSQGLKLGENTLPRDPTISEKTPDEFNFAVMVELFLGSYQDPAEREIAIETLSVISYIQDNYPDLKAVEGVVDLTYIISNGLRIFWDEWVEGNKKDLKLAAPALVKKRSYSAEDQDESPSKAQVDNVSSGLVIRDAEATNGNDKQEEAPLVESPGSDQHNEPAIPILTPLVQGDYSFDSNISFARRLFYDLPFLEEKGTCYYLSVSALKDKQVPENLIAGILSQKD
jgi:phosphorylase kinase alpha/beta subunit